MFHAGWLEPRRSDGAVAGTMTFGIWTGVGKPLMQRCARAFVADKKKSCVDGSHLRRFASIHTRTEARSPTHAHPQRARLHIRFVFFSGSRSAFRVWLRRNGMDRMKTTTESATTTTTVAATVTIRYICRWRQTERVQYMLNWSSKSSVYLELISFGNKWRCRAINAWSERRRIVRRLSVVQRHLFQYLF